MTFRNDDEFTRNLNDRIKELEDMTNEIEDQTAELEHKARASEDTIDETRQIAVNQASESRTEGDTIYFTARVDASKPLKLNVTNNNGDIQVSATDGDSVEIAATSDSDTVSHEHWFFQQVDNEITLRPNWQVGSHVGDLATKLKNQLREGFRTSDWSSKDFRFGLDVNYDLVVRIPRHLAEGSHVNIKNANGDGSLRDVAAEVDFKTANGDLEVSNVGGNLTLNTANGDLDVENVTGNVHASTANGDIRIKSVTGSVETNTANGDVRVDSATGWIGVRTANGDINLENATWMGGRLVTIGGDIHVDAALVNATTYAFDSVSGGIHITARMPQGGATFTARSVTGEVFANDLEKRGKREWVLGEGTGPTLNAKTVSGDINYTASIDPNLSPMREEAGETAAMGSADSPAASEKSSDVNINLDLEIERAKGWVKDLGTRLSAMLGDLESKRPTPPPAPEAPEAPAAPEPVSPEHKAATAERRARLLESVKNGDMTVDEALAELEREA